MCELRHPECQRLFLREVDRQTQRLARRYKLQAADRDDVFQEIALDAWRRLTRYQATRGDLEPFLGLVTLNQARKIEARFCRRRACPDIPLETRVTDGGDLTLEDSLTEDDGFLALLGNPVDTHARVEMVLDLAEAVARLPDDLQRLCACLAHETPGAARRLCNLSNTGLYRQIEDLRLHFCSFGLGTC